MADTKITALTALTAADPINDVIPIVDVSDTSMAGSGTTKKISVNNILGASGTATLASATITGDLTVRTNKLFVNATNVGIGTVTPNAAYILDLTTANDARARQWVADTSFLGSGNLANGYQLRTLGASIDGIKISNYANSVEYLRIDNTGNAGLGVVPSASSACINMEFGAYGSTLSARSNASAAQFAISSNAVGNWYAPTYKINGFATQYTQQGNDGTHTWYNAITGIAGDPITFTPRMTIDASGNLLLGTTSLLGTERLNVTKTTAGSYLARFINTNTTVDTFGITVKYSASAPNDASHNFLYVEDNVNVRAQIYANGGLANYSANNVNLSDARTKTDIKPLTSYWNKIKALELVTFKYKDQTHDDDNIGLISQQVESVAPEFVSNDGFGETPADGVPLKSIYTTDLYHAAIKALQEAMTRIEVLESKLA